MLWGELRNQRGEKTEFVRIERPKKIIICKNWKVKKKESSVFHRKRTGERLDNII